MGAEDKIKLNKLAKAAIFGVCYYFILIFYLAWTLFLAMDPPDLVRNLVSATIPVSPRPRRRWPGETGR